jgi:hypothetical protein
VPFSFSSWLSCVCGCMGRRTMCKQKDSILWQFCCTLVWKIGKCNEVTLFLTGKYTPCLFKRGNWDIFYMLSTLKYKIRCTPTFCKDAFITKQSSCAMCQIEKKKTVIDGPPLCIQMCSSSLKSIQIPAMLCHGGNLRLWCDIGHFFGIAGVHLAIPE